MQLINRLMLVAVLGGLSACSTLSSLNPFSSSEKKNVPAALLEFKPAMQVKAAWTVNLANAANYQFSPAIVGQVVYAAAADGTLVKVEVGSGKVLWRITAESKLTAGVGADAETIAVAGEKGQLLAFDSNGKLRWKLDKLNEILSSPAVGNGLVVVRSIDNKITAFDAATGEKKWANERPLPALTLRAAPGILFAQQQVLVALPGGRIASFASSNGNLRWEAVVGEPKGATELERVADVSGMPVLVANEVCASSYQGRVGCFDLNTGAARWTKTLSSEAGVAADQRFVFAIDVNSVVNTYNRDGGASLWRNDKLQHRRLSAPASFDRAVAVGDLAGYVHFLSREDGAMLARVATDGSQIVGAPQVSGSSVIVQTRAGALTALTTE